MRSLIEVGLLSVPLGCALYGYEYPNKSLKVIKYLKQYRLFRKLLTSGVYGFCGWHAFMVLNLLIFRPLKISDGSEDYKYGLVQDHVNGIMEKNASRIH